MTDAFSLQERDSIRPEEILALRDSVNWKGGDQEIWAAVLKQSLIVVGVRNGHGQLIGIGFVAGSLRHAVLCDLCVHPDYRGRGIGRKILEERLRRVEALGVTCLYTTLSEGNFLRRRYEEVGFTASGNNYFRIRNAAK